VRNGNGGGRLHLRKERGLRKTSVPSFPFYYGLKMALKSCLKAHTHIIPFPITPKEVKNSNNLVINLTKHEQNLYSEHYKILINEIKETFSRFFQTPLINQFQRLFHIFSYRFNNNCPTSQYQFSVSVSFALL
jgi:hypothetical protein